MFTLTVETDGAAFADDQLAEELSTILRRVAGTLTCLTLGNPDAGSIRDTTGNTVGAWSFSEAMGETCTQCGAALAFDPFGFLVDDLGSTCCADLLDDDGAAIPHYAS